MGDGSEAMALARQHADCATTFSCLAHNASHFAAYVPHHGAISSSMGLCSLPLRPASGRVQHRRRCSYSAFHFPKKTKFRCKLGPALASTVIEKDEPQQAMPVPPVRAYPFQELEPKWQKFWDTHQTFRTPDSVDSSKPKFYVLDMFPYPSGAGLHVGHPEGYTATDIVSRYKRMRGFNVLHPMGWDAFGLPAEQYAIETGTHPSLTTKKNIDRFRQQLKSLGFSYDWKRELSTTDPEYYRWTQWIFIQLFKKGLAYQAEVPVNWCPALGTVLANEEVIDGVSERGGHPVVRKPMRQWMLRITEYADRLLNDLEELDWPENIKDMQRNWIGRSEGAQIQFFVKGLHGALTNPLCLRVYTTRPDTVFGVTYLVIAPEHPLVKKLTSPLQEKAVESYVEVAARKSDLERTELQKEKTGVFTGACAINPATNEGIPIWVADYVLGSYGTGAIMAVPAHDSRDYDFATKFGLPMRAVVLPEGNLWDGKGAYTGEGMLTNSCCEATGVDVNGLSIEEATKRIVVWMETRGIGQCHVNYKLRDWLFARQRYWGEPFPVIFLEDTGEAKVVQEEELPVMLPEISDFSPTGSGDPPLAKATDWVMTLDTESGKVARRETNTMPQWAGSCWYYLRFMDPHNKESLVGHQKERYWGPVDLYVGGAEHSVLHLLYARFWHKVLYDLGIVSTKEPFQRLVNQGMILGELEFTVYRDSDGNLISAEHITEGISYKAEKVLEKEVTKLGDSYVLKCNSSIRVGARAHKMSKSRGNVVNPDDIVFEYGADSLRLYEMFMGPLRDTKIWSTKGVEGVHRFLARAWRLVVGPPISPGLYPEGSAATMVEPSHEQLRILHQCIQKVTEEIEGMRFNTAIAAMMEFLNTANKWETRPKAVLEKFLLLLAPFAPHLAEELWQRLGHSESLAYELWPEAIDKYLKEDKFTLAIQVNGKTRGTIQISIDADETTAVAMAVQEKSLSKYLENQVIVKSIYVPGRILNIIVSK